MTAAVLLSCAREEIVPVEPDTSTDVSVEVADNYVLGEARVYLSEEMTAMVEEAIEAGSILTKSSAMNGALEELGITEMYRLFPHAGEFEGRTRREGLHRWYVVKYSQDVALTKAQSSLEMVEGVDFFEPVRQIKINDFNDLSSDLWGLNNTSNPGFDINVKPVWNEYTTGSSKVVVSVVDTGIDLNHEDLASNCLSTGHYNAVSGTTYIEAGDHGTHVAGTIAAVSNNGKGVAGIAGGDKAKGVSGVKLMSSQIFGADGKGTGRASADAIKRAADNGAIISQNSWGYNYDADGDGQLTGQEYTDAMNARIMASDKAAVDYFIKYAGCDDAGEQLPDSPMKGGVVFFAAGNDGIDNGCPANYEPIIAVGAITKNGKKASFSNYGDWVDIAAPGQNIYSTIPNNRYEYLSGTSMACPHISGVAALVVSHCGGPGFTNAQLEEKLLMTANRTITPPTDRIGGLVDAYEAIRYKQDGIPGEVKDLNMSTASNKIHITCTVTDDSDGEPNGGYLVIYGLHKEDLEAVTPMDAGNAMSRHFENNLATGETLEMVVDKLDFESAYYLKVYAQSREGEYSEHADIQRVVTGKNTRPEINVSFRGSAEEIIAGDKMEIDVTVTDADGHAVDLRHEPGSEAETLEKTGEGSWKLTIAYRSGKGEFTSRLTGMDEYGMETSKTITYRNDY
jgi:hypothetical protein